VDREGDYIGANKSNRGKDELRPMALQAGADILAYKADPPEKLLELIRGSAEEKAENPLRKDSRPSNGGV
jgi:hypothetical protein